MPKPVKLEGTAAWGKAIGLFLTFISLRAAYESIKQSETGPSEHILLLRSINNKLERLAPPLEDIDYEEIL